MRECVCCGVWASEPFPGTILADQLFGQLQAKRLQGLVGGW